MTKEIPTKMTNMNARITTNYQTGSLVHCDYVRQNVTSYIYLQQSIPPRQLDYVQELID